jgi:hypothetical protein
MQDGTKGLIVTINLLKVVMITGYFFFSFLIFKFQRQLVLVISTLIYLQNVLLVKLFYLF